MPSTRLDARAVGRWCRSAHAALLAARDEIDALNVFPVPDRDTGTNLCLTLQAMTDALDCAPAVDGLADALETVTRAALVGARGSSGVILSQLLRGAADVLAAPPAGDPPSAGGLLSAALSSAADLAYAAVAEPVEGTMLTVARAAAESAAAARVAGAATVPELARAALDGGIRALEHTTEQLPVLRRAGVVDAGGRGVCLLLEALYDVLTGADTRPPRPGKARDNPGGATAETKVAGVAPASTRGAGAAPGHRPGPAGFEVMFLLDAAEAALPELRRTLARLGDSLVVVGRAGLWHVHVHVADAGAAIEAAIRTGRPHRIRVSAIPGIGAGGGLVGTQPAQPDRSVVAVVAGEGLAALFEAAGAMVVATAPARPVTDEEILDAIRRAGTPDVVVLPNGAHSTAAAESAAEQARASGLRVAVVPVKASVQALAALAVHEPARRFDDDVVHMTAAAGSTRHGAVTVARRAAVTTAGVCRPGDVLGVIDGDFAVIGADVESVARIVVDRMLSGGGELVTLVTAAGGCAALADELVAHLHASRPEVDTVVYTGGPAHYPLLVGVE